MCCFSGRISGAVLYCLVACGERFVPLNKRQDLRLFLVFFSCQLSRFLKVLLRSLNGGEGRGLDGWESATGHQKAKIYTLTHTHTPFLISASGFGFFFSLCCFTVGIMNVGLSEFVEGD